MDYHFGQKNVSHSVQWLSLSTAARQRWKALIALAQGYTDCISLTMAYFTKPKCFKNSWSYISYCPPVQTDIPGEVSCLHPPDSGLSSCPFSCGGISNDPSHHYCHLLGSSMFQDTTQGPPGTGMIPGEYPGANAQHQFQCYSKHPITTDQFGIAVRNPGTRYCNIIPLFHTTLYTAALQTWPGLQSSSQLLHVTVDDVTKPCTGFPSG